MITIAQLAGEAANKVRLQPVNFAAGEAQPVAEADGYLEKVAGIMKDRPEINIKICGRAVAADRVVLGAAVAAADTKDKASAPDKATATVTDQQLLELAATRADFVKDRLVAKYGASASRAIDDVARVELLI